MSKTKIEKIAEQMKELSDLRAQITELITKYNSLSLQSDNSGRLALLSAESWKDDYMLDNPDEQDKEAITFTHEDFVRQNERPTPHVDRCGANAWFPSSIC